jgi:hypothetical protein
LKKLMLLAALLAMLVVAVVPAIAQVSQEGEQDADSGDSDISSTTTGGGDNSIQCVNDQLTSQTGNAQTQNQAIEYASSGSPSPSGDATITVEPNRMSDNIFSCEPQVNQAASASG